MTIEKQVVVDNIETLENGCVQVRTATRVFDDDKLIGQSFHRHVVTPGDDYAGEDARVQAICKATHTPDAVQAYMAAKSRTI